jgi:hypothetical protein
MEKRFGWLQVDEEPDGRLHLELASSTRAAWLLGSQLGWVNLSQTFFFFFGRTGVAVWT